MSRPVILPTNDIAFKKLFTDSDDTDLLISFLNAMLCNFIDFEINEVSLQEPVEMKCSQDKTKSFLEIYCKDSANNNFIVKIEIIQTPWSRERIQYYTTKAFAEQVDRLDTFHSARPMFLIAILCCTMFKEHERYITCHQTLDVVDHKQYLRGCNYIFVELPKFKKLDAEAVKNETEAWCMFLKDSTEKDLMKNLSQKSASIKKAIKTLNTLMWTDEEWMIYEEIWKINLDNRMAREYSLEQARKEGLEESKMKRVSLETAKNLLAMNLPIETIAQVTSLTLKEIEALKNQK